MTQTSSSQSSTTAARRLAHKILLRVFEEGAFLDHLIDASFARSDLSPRDQGLVSELCYGVTRYALALDQGLQKFLKQPIKNMAPPARMALRMGAYQIVMMRVPTHSAVNESVGLLREPKLRGLINAVLRKFSAEPHDVANNFDLQSMPKWIVDHVRAVRGSEHLDAWIKACNQPAPVSIRCRPQRITCDVLADQLRPEVRAIEVHPTLPNLLQVQGLQAPIAHPGYQAGDWTLQDPAASLVGLLVNPQPHEHILDLCAAPGGKACHMADLGGPHVRITATDQHPGRVELIERQAHRLGLEGHVTAHHADGTSLSAIRRITPGLFDCVVVDAPCSGLGTLRRHPEIRHHTPSPTPDLLRIQASLLETAAALVKPEGRIVYAVCSFTCPETTDLIASFLHKHDDFYILPLSGILKKYGEPFHQGHVLRTWTDSHTMDGFFAVALGRRVVAPKSSVD